MLKKNIKSRCRHTKKELKALYTRIDEILFYRWDPIGLADSSGARDEYANYTYDIYKMMLKGASANELEKHLNYLSTQWIGVSTNSQKDKETAVLIHAVVNDTIYYPKLHVVILD